MVVSVAAYVILRKIRPSLRIAIGTVALGLAIDGVASHLGGRGVNTAPAVLLGMGFAADYLSHAASGHTPLETTCRHVGVLHSHLWPYSFFLPSTFPLHRIQDDWPSLF